MNKKTKLFAFLLVVSMLACTSCKKDNDNDPTAGGTGILGNISGTIDGHEYVDLELPSGTLWATCNVGANSPEGYGNYYAWGETTTKDEYNYRYYKWCNGDFHSITKYNTRSSYGTIDSKIVLESEDDAANANWGGAWRMPTYDELRELYDNCTWEWTTLNNVNGYRFAHNGKSIFLPAAGLYSGSSILYVGSYIYYWSSSLHFENPDRAHELESDGDNMIMFSSIRPYGLSVRPVCSPQ